VETLNAAAANGQQLALFPGSASVNSVPSATTAADERARQRADITAGLLRFTSAAEQANINDVFRSNQSTNYTAWCCRMRIQEQQRANLQLAIQTTVSMDSNHPTLPALRAQLVALCFLPLEEAPVLLQMPQISMLVPSPVAPAPAAQTVSDVNNSQNDRRIRPRTGPPIAIVEELEDPVSRLMQRFTQIELGGDGQCLFCVLQYLQDHEIAHQHLHDLGIQIGEHVNLTRARIANHLDVVKDSVCDQTESNLAVAMVDEAGSCEAYLVWIRDESSCGGRIEVFAWANLMQICVHLFSTTMWQAEPYHEVINSNGDSLQKTVYILHLVGRGGHGGHYRLLLPIIASSADTACSNNASSSQVIDLSGGAASPR
jgi:hypothetical protein